MIPNINVISGTIGDDILVGTPAKVIDGDACRDILSAAWVAMPGWRYWQRIYGGAGGDVLDDVMAEILFGGDGKCRRLQAAAAV